jgi:intracellular sulfur oxidation DsrE/DsrF family protein
MLTTSTTRAIARTSAMIVAIAVASTATIAAARVGIAGAAPAATNAASHAGSKEPSNRWLDGLKAKHKQFFDAPSPNGGIPLVHVLNYYDTYNKAFNVKDADVDAVLTFYGATTFYGLNDAAWAKYRLGEFLETNDATGKPATANPWRATPVVLGMTLPQASIEALHQRGATFILCNNALTIFSAMLAQKRGLDANAVYQDLKANILPEVELVPGMVVAVEQAQRAGLSYHRN